MSLEELGPPGKGESETSPRKIAARTPGYPKHERSRIKYNDYRKQGLPITSSHVGSTIQQINLRTNGGEKFWNQGAEPLLQLPANHLSQTTDLDHLWKNRKCTSHPQDGINQPPKKQTPDFARLGGCTRLRSETRRGGRMGRESAVGAGNARDSLPPIVVWTPKGR